MTLRSSRIEPSIPRSLVRLNAARARRRAPARRARARAATRCRRRGSRRIGPLDRRGRRTRRRCRGRRRCTPAARAEPARDRRAPAEPRARLDRLARERPVGRPRPQIRSRAQSPVLASSRPVVEAMVASLASVARQPERRAGRGSARCAPRLKRGASSLLGEQLEDGVDRHRLDAGPAVQLLARDARMGALDSPSVRVVAVVEREPEQPPVGVEQAVVDAPARRRRRRAAAPPGGRAPEPVERCLRTAASRFQCSPSGSHTGLFANRCTTSSATARRRAGRGPPGRTRRRDRRRANTACLSHRSPASLARAAVPADASPRPSSSSEHLTDPLRERRDVGDQHAEDRSRARRPGRCRADEE